MPVISGEAVVGKIRVEYQFLDINPEDKEGATQFTWLRVTNVNGANGPTYVIVPADVGQIISVMVKPKSDDGIEGASVLALMQNAVDDGLTKFITEATDEPIFPIDENVKTAETLEAIFEAVSEDALPPLAIENRPVNDDLDERSLACVQYITPWLRLAPSSPTQFIGFRHHPSKLLSNQALNRITFELIGRPIDITLLEDAIKLVNQAYADAGFKLSRALVSGQIVEDGLIEITLIESEDMHHHF